MRRLLSWIRTSRRDRRVCKIIDQVFYIVNATDCDKASKLHDLRDLRDYLTATIENVRQADGPK